MARPSSIQMPEEYVIGDDVRLTNGRVVSGGAISTGPVGTGTLTLADLVTLRSSGTTARTIQNNLSLSGSITLGDATNNVAEYTAVRNALRAAADAGATSAHVRMDSPVVFGHLSGASRARAEHLIQLKEEVEAQVARYPGRVTFARIPRERNGVADELAKDGARASKTLNADRQP